MTRVNRQSRRKAGGRHGGEDTGPSMVSAGLRLGPPAPGAAPALSVDTGGRNFTPMSTPEVAASGQPGPSIRSVPMWR